jgi:hypothetical protein
MSEVMDVLNAFATPLKLAWVGWIAWGVGQYFWYRHERSILLVKKSAAVATAVEAKKPAVAKSVAAQAAEAPVVGRLITPTHVTAEPKISMPNVPQSGAADGFEPARVSAHSPAFDPAKAVIEAFGVADDGVLDKFVRDFEMQDARPRRRRSRPAEPSSHGVEAPQAP